MTGNPDDSQPEPDAGTQGLTARDMVLLLPNVAKLLWRLARDGRVPITTKLLAAGAAIYLASPLDIIPDWLPVIGYLDDAVLVALVLRRIIRTVPRQAIADHWDGAIPLEDLVRRLSFRKKRGKPSGD